MNGFKMLIIIISSSIYYISATSTFNNYEKRLVNDELAYRLPKTLVPIDYNLYLSIYPEDDSYTGNVNITFNVIDSDIAVKDLYLHADTYPMRIWNVVLNNNISCSFNISNDDKILTLHCVEGALGDNNVVSIDFTTKFPVNDGFGFVKTRFPDQLVSYVLIQPNLKPTYARVAFPCMDEPNLKATFTLTVKHPREYTVLSNTLVSSEDTDMRGNTTTTFITTPKMSTYLVSVIISKFVVALTGNEDQYEFKIFTRQSVRNLTNKVVGPYYSKIIAKLNDFTGVTYENISNIQCYQVAINDYYPYSMGEFGLFMYRESDILDEGDKTSPRDTQNILMTMAYKLSHQWFGGDISTKWWSDVWANEAVSTYLKYFIPHQINNEFDLANQFVVEVIQNALQLDALPVIRPLSSNESDVKTPRDIQHKLEVFSNLKGAAILHTINSVVGGDESFKLALQNHVAVRRGLNTDGKDLLMDLLTLQDSHIYSYLQKWILSPGYPVIKVTLKNSTDVEVVEITHKRFVYPMDNMPSYDNDDWDIPLSRTTQSEKIFNKTIDVFYTPEGLTFTNEDDGWIMFNMQGGNFYRVNYDETLWRRIIRSLKSEERKDIHVLNRAQLVDDIFSIARIGDVNYSLAFELAEFLVDETDYYPWYSALNAFTYIMGKFDDYAIEAGFKKYILNLMDNVVYIPSTKTARTARTHTDLLRDAMILEWACYLGHFGCIAYATEKYKLFKESRSLDDHNLRRVIFCNGIRYSKDVEQDWRFMWNTYTPSSSSVHQQKEILHALGCAEDHDVLTSYLYKTITPYSYSGIKRQDAMAVYNSIFSSSIGLDVIIKFLEAYRGDIIVFYGVDGLAEVVYMVAERLSTDEQIEWLNSFIDNSDLANYTDISSKARMLASVNNYWKKHYQSELTTLFPHISTTSTSTISTSTSTSTSTETTTASTEFTTSVSTTTESSCIKIFISEFCIIFTLLIFKLL